MAVSFVGAGTAATPAGGSTSTGALNIPTGLAANDVLIIICHGRTTTYAHSIGNGASGWAEVATQASATSNGRFSIWWKRTSGSESPAPSVDFAGAQDSVAAQVLAFRGCKTTGNPWNTASSIVAHSAVDGTTYTGTALTPTVADTMIVFLGGSMDNNTWGTPGGSVDQSAYTANAVGTDNSIFYAYDSTPSHSANVQQSAPSLAQATLGADAGYKITLALEPGAGGGGSSYSDSHSASATASDAVDAYLPTKRDSVSYSATPTDALGLAFLGKMPSLVGAGTIATGTNSVSPGLPAGVIAGDLLVALCQEANQTPSGWSKPNSMAFGYVRFATGTGDAPTFTGSGAMAAVVVAYRDVSQSRPFTSLATDFTGSGSRAGFRVQYDKSVALALYNARTVGDDFTLTGGPSMTTVTNQTATLSGSVFRLAVLAHEYSAPSTISTLTWTPSSANSLFAWLALTPAGPMFEVVDDAAVSSDASDDRPHDTAPDEDLTDHAIAIDDILHVSEPYLISASPVVHGYGSVTIPVPSGAQPGDIALLMGIAPDGPTDYRPRFTGDNDWVHAATWNWCKVIGSSEPSFIIDAGTGVGAPGSNPDASIGAAVAIFRNVDPNYLPTTANGYAIAENGGYASGPVPPTSPSALRNPTTGINNAFTAPVDKCLVVASFQSEACDSTATDVSWSVAGTPRKQWEDDSGTEQASRFHDTTFFWRHAFYVRPLIKAGDTTGYLSWKPYGSGGGWDNALSQPYPGPPAWFSLILLRPSPFVEDLTDYAVSQDWAEATLPLSLTDSATALDGFSGSAARPGTISESAQPAESVASAARRASQVAETVTVSDALASRLIARATLDAAAQAWDAVAGGGGQTYSVGLSESTGAADSLSAGAVSRVGLSESTTAADALGARLVLGALLTESAICLDRVGVPKPIVPRTPPHVEAWWMRHRRGGRLWSK